MFNFIRHFKEKRETRDRILALDLLRGLFMVCIVVDHTVGWSPSFISMVAGQNLLFASAAEGFFAISGLLVGYVYRDKIAKNVRWVFMKLWKRGLLLYALSVLFSFIFYFWANLIPEASFGLAQWQGTFLSFVVSTFSLSTIYGWHDFLGIYAALMFFAPFAVWLCSRGFAYIVLITSFMVWLVVHSAPGQSFLAWQIIFMFSIVLGYHLNTIEPTVVKLNKLAKNIPYVTLITIAITTYLISIFVLTMAPVVYNHVQRIFPGSIVDAMVYITYLRDTYFFPRENVNIFRLLIGIVWFSALYASVRKYEAVIEKKTRSFFSIIGRNSLFVFIFHGILLFIVYTLMGTQAEGQANIVLNTFVHSVLAYIVFVVAKNTDRIRKLSNIKDRLRKGEVT